MFVGDTLTLRASKKRRESASVRSKESTLAFLPLFMEKEREKRGTSKNIASQEELSSVVAL